MDNTFKFSVLMSVYEKEKPQFLKTALESIINQTLKPNEIVLIKDGMLTNELDDVIYTFAQKYNKLFKIISLRNNVGLGEALNIGIQNCSNEIIARMDTDDIARKDRFEKQIFFLQKHPDIDIVGSWISEFEGDPENLISYRKVPTSHKEIYAFGQFRSPLNHMTVMFKKEAVLGAGSYQTFKSIEDYWLWARMLKQGYKFANIPDCLVNVRAGNEMLKRRANLRYFFNSELPLHTQLYKIGYISYKQYLKNIFSKFLLRALPYKVMGRVYKIFLRSKV